MFFRDRVITNKELHFYNELQKKLLKDYTKSTVLPKPQALNFASHRKKKKKKCPCYCLRTKSGKEVIKPRALIKWDIVSLANSKEET